MLHILVGENYSHDSLKKVARTNRPLRWIVPKRAQEGEQVLFFIPDQGIVGRGEIVSRPSPTMFGRKKSFEASVTRIEVLPRPIPIDSIIGQFPDWKWPTYPRSYTSVESHFGAQLVAFLDQRAYSAADEPSIKAMEGVAREIVVLSRSRNRRLRQEALKRANGVCEVCNQNFARLLGGLGLRALQVHHRRQLSVTRTPTVTGISDLAVVCANCHCLIHSDPQRALAPALLRERLAAER
ncbi:MAG TPA: hypothetical protein VK747_19865 [Blastocatellia bacterium]|nr:hypothetical protein [Blastocatellia bacterium]